MLKKITVLILSFYLVLTPTLVLANSYAASPAYSRQVGNVWHGVRTVIKSSPTNRSVQGFFLATAVTVIGDDLVNRYQNGQFSLAADQIKQAAAALYAAGAEGGEYLAREFSNLRSQYTCSQGECTVPSDPFKQTYPNVFFKTQNGTEKYTSVDSFVKANINKSYESHTIRAFQPSNALTNLFSGTSTGSTLTLIVDVTCGVNSGNACGTDHLGNPLKTNFISMSVVVVKPGTAVETTETDRKVTPAEIAESIAEPVTAQDYAEVVSVCYLYPNTCSSTFPQPKTGTLVAPSVLPNGVPVDLEYPAKGVTTGSSGNVTDIGSSEGVKPSTLPAACEYAEFICSALQAINQTTTSISDFLKTDQELPPEQPVEVEEKEIAIYRHENHIVFGKTCPFTPTIRNLDLGFGQMSFEEDLTFVCTFGSDARPYVIGLGNLGALIYLLVGIRNGNG